MAEPQQKPLTADDWTTAKPITQDDWNAATVVGGAPAQTDTPAVKPQTVGRLVSETWDRVNPFPLIKALLDPTDVPIEELSLLQGMKAPPGLGKVVRAMGDRQHGEWEKAKKAYETGHYGDAVMYAISSGVPVAGPMATQFGEHVKEGDYVAAGADFLGVVGPSALSKVKVGPIKLGGIKNANPQEALALQYARDTGVPMDAGTVTGSPVIKGAQYLADRTLAAAPSVNKAQEAQTTALRASLGDLVKKAGPAQTPETAGAAVQQAVSSRVSALHQDANAAYDSLRALEPKFTKPVQVGTKDSPSGLVVPVMENMAFPVDLKPVKAMLKPVWDRMRRQMPVTQQQASPGLKAIENIMTGPDTSPASVVDLDLSAIKAIARGADRPELRDLGQGLAASAVKSLDAAVMKAVSEGGATAVNALKAGRAATRAKYLAAEIEEGLRSEPVKAFRQATEPKDASIAQLRELGLLAPAELPKIGRAFLEDLSQTAMREGGFDKTGTISEKWANLGPQTKRLLFPDQKLVTQLDRFFLAAKKLAQNPNPSGSGGMVQIGSQGALMVFNPVMGVMQQLSGLALSKAFRNPKFIQLLADGMTMKPQTMTSKAWMGSIAPFFNEGVDR